MRPATFTSVQLESGGEQTLDVKHGDRLQTVRARWIVDASGVAALLARKKGWWESNTEHPTAAVLVALEGREGLGQPRARGEVSRVGGRAVYGIRNTATNHIIGDGWWSWWIPLKGGDVSVGVVFDQRLVDFPQDGAKLGDRLKSFLMKHPVGAGDDRGCRVLRGGHALAQEPRLLQHHLCR